MALTAHQEIELKGLKQKAAALYKRAMAWGELDCGRGIAELLKSDVGVARRDFSKLWKRVKELDPSAPDDPFKDYKG